jgi:hypothetical protein
MKKISVFLVYLVNMIFDRTSVFLCYIWDKIVHSFIRSRASIFMLSGVTGYSNIIEGVLADVPRWQDSINDQFSCIDNLIKTKRRKPKIRHQRVGINFKTKHTKKMRKFSILIWGMMIAGFAYSQTVQTWTESFDGTLPASFSVHAPSSGGGWAHDSLFAPNSSGTNPKSYLGKVPNNVGEITYLQTQEYDCSNYEFVTIQFSHICKISTSDTARIEYQLSGQTGWYSLPYLSEEYSGSSLNYAANSSFNAASYSEWDAANDLTQPTSSWWKEEAFNLRAYVGYGKVRFRFIITHGPATGTQSVRGWLIDNLQVRAATYEIKPPVVQFLAPLVQGNVTSVGPWKITAKVKTATNARLETPWLTYTTNSTFTDSILMTMIEGDSLWEASIPQFLLGTIVNYSITGRDTTGNSFTNSSQYIITQPPGGLVNSAAMYSIDLEDTITAGGTVPIVVTIRNKGSAYLTSATIDHSVNGTNGTTRFWTGSLPWDFNKQDTIGYYNPTRKAHDIIKVWISSPNGANDSTKTDDTLTESIYGSGDYLIEFVTVFADTVYRTGPFPVSARIRKVSGTAVTNVNLEITATHNGTPTNTTSSMTLDPADNLWKTDIPQTQYESNVVYSISLTDSYNYTETVSKQFYIKRPYGGSGAAAAGDTLLAGPSTGITRTIEGAPYHAIRTGGSKVLYLGTELGTYMSGGYIYKIGYYSSASYLDSNLTCYFKAVDDTKITTTTTDPVGDGATLVMTGTITTTAGYLETEILLDNSFYLPPGKNLMIYWNNPHSYSTGGLITTQSWKASSLQDDMVTRNYHLIPSSTSQLSVWRPDTRFYFQSGTGGNYNDTSVALVAIESPPAGVTAGTTVPVRARILNKGIKPLESCIVSWSKDGTFQSSVSYTGPLPEEFTDTITVGYYTSTSGKIDTIDVWVSMPNGIVDPQLDDDTSRIITQACGAPLSGTIQVPVGASSISNIITTIRTCGLGGNLTLQLKGTYIEDIDLTNLTTSLNGYTLTITSLNNQYDSAIIQPASGASAGITFGNTKNIILNAITVNTENITAHGIHFTNSCSNIVVRDCKLLANPNSSSTSTASPIYKSAGTSGADSILFINNILRGGNTGFFFEGGLSTAYSTRIVFDSNKISDNYAYGIKALNTDFLHISYNTITSRSSNSALRWDAIWLENANGNIIGNRISQRTNGVSMDGLHLLNYSNSHTTQQALIANNEIMFQGNQSVIGLYINNGVKADVIHNSFYLVSSSTVYGFSINNVSMNNVTIRNNNIVTSGTGGYLFGYAGNGSTGLYDIDNNNFYATGTGHSLGLYNNSSITTMAQLRQFFSPTTNMVSQLPAYMNSTSTDLTPNNTSLICPSLPAVTTDINGKVRQSQTSMGAYQMTQHALDLGLIQFIAWNSEVILNQSVSIDIEVQNFGTNNIQNVVFGWSYNNRRQNDTSWTPTTPLPFLGTSNINLGSFNVTNSINTYDVEVWIISVNSTTDAEQANDTLRENAIRSALVEWYSPFVDDTIHSLSFEVYAKIHSSTGAPSTPPQLITTSTVSGTNPYNDTLPMTSLGNDIWGRMVSNPYFDTKVIYSLSVSDNINNTLTIVDSTYLKDLQKTHDTVIIGAMVQPLSTNTQYEAPAGLNHSWTRQIYLYRELSPTLSPAGITIESIAWYHVVASLSMFLPRDNQICYMLAVNDSIEQNIYEDPIMKGATLVWSGTLNRLTSMYGWLEVPLQTPFFLPANNHLEIIWESHNAKSVSGLTKEWQYTATSYPSTYFNYNTSNTPSPASCGAINNRPNLKAVIRLSPGNFTNDPNLSIQKILKPINDPNELCAPDNSPVQIVVENLSLHDYDYSATPATFSVEVLNPLGTKDAASIIKNTGILAPGKLDTIEIMPALPLINSGIYHIKTWLTSSVDRIHVDDTSVYDFITNRIGLPIDEDFGAGIPPLWFVTDTIPSLVYSTAVWESYVDPTSQMQPPPGSGGMLRYVGSMGSMAFLSTRQLDLNGVTNPEITFWYYHDTSAAANDGTYIDVKVIADGISATEMHLEKYHPTIHGWKEYKVNLGKYTSAQCVLVRIETMNMGGPQSIQYLGHITITSLADLKVFPILIDPEPVICDLKNKNVSVVLASTTNQAIDLSGNELIIELGSNTSSYSLQGKTVKGNESDTILLLSNADLTGVNRIRVYLKTPVDGNASNDTTSYLVDIAPGISVILDPMTGPNSCFPEGEDVQQTVIINNTGNISISNIDLVLQVDTGNSMTSYATLNETYTGTIPAKSSYTYTFTKTYKIIRSNEYYYLRVKAQLGCDASVKGEAISEECADLSNVSIVSLINPPAGQTDVVGSTNNKIEVSILNETLKSYSNVGITAQIEDEDGQALSTPITDTITTIAASLTPQSFAFSTPYTVPNVSTYVIKIFLNSVDSYTKDDTLTDTRNTNYVGINGIERNEFTLGQNIPNPANNSTRIDYSIPEAGEVVFYVYSISKQLLYVKSIETERGTHSIELNTSTFAAGVYFYSIEYKGQRLVKRMSIK